ncbi:MAG TPA: archease [Candidatus Deferrimicrobiaceae bacterium]
MPFRFLPKVALADVAFAAWGDSREGMFSACAEALLRTMVERPETVARSETRSVRLSNGALDLLLFEFLQELVFLKDARLLLVHPDALRITEGEGGYALEARLIGERIDRARHPLLVDVKAVTLHRLAVARVRGRWKATVVLDV